MITLGIFATVILAFNFWFIDHAEDAIEQIVDQQSKGKLKLKIEKFRFNWIKNRIELNKAVFYSADSSANSVYNVSVNRITIKAKGFLPLLFNKEILIDSIHLYSPSVTLTRLQVRTRTARKKDTTGTSADDHFTVSREMGRIAKSINDAINVLKINRFLLDNGSLSLIDNTRPEETPFVLNKVHIRLDGLQVDSTTTGRHKKVEGKILFTEDIAIQTHDQNLTLPGNRHMISFKNFKITLQDKRVEFDSCTIRGVKGDSSKTAFKIYFDSLRLTKINFDTLFYSEVIKADSVFAANPKIFLDVDADQKTARHHNKRIQKVDDLVQQLFGDIMLNYVVVQNAFIKVNTINKGKINSFTSKDNDFELQGFQIRQNYEQPVRVEKFLMTLHNYQTSLQDGRYTTSFDSVQFLDDAIYLTKFRLQEFRKGKVINDLQMPRFELKGLSWEALLYQNKLNASSATFMNPDITYSVAPKKNKKEKSIFQTLSDIGQVMNLDALGIRNGNIHLKFGKGAALHLSNTNLSVLPGELTASKKVKNIQNAVKTLNFTRARFSKGPLTAVLNNVKMDNANGLKATDLVLKGDGIHAVASTVGIRDVILDSANQNMLLSGLHWASASVNIDQPAQENKQKKKALTGLLLKDLKGNNTSLNVHRENRNITAFFNSINAKSIYKKKNAGLIAEGLAVAGKDFLMTGPDMRLAVDQMLVNDQQNSIFKNLQFQKITETDSILVNIPQIAVIPNISRIINGNLQLNKIILSDPDILAHFGKKDTAGAKNKKKAPEILLGEALLERPHLELQFVNKKNQTNTIKWDGQAANSYLHIRNLKSTEKQLLDADAVKVYLTNFEFLNNDNGNRFATDYNKLNILLERLQAKKNGDEKVDWSTLLSVLSMDKLVFDSLGKKNAVLKLDAGEVRNIYLGSATLKNIGEILKASTRLDVRRATGSFTTFKNHLHWYNFNFKNGFFKADSLNFSPNQSIEDYSRKKAFNEDYLQVATGAITGGPWDTKIYGNDSILKIGGVHIDSIRLLSFKDKTQPDTAIKYKLLPTRQILGIPIKINIDSLGLSNMYVEYREINPQTKTLGIIPVNNLNAHMYHIKNYDLGPADSLFIVAGANVIGAMNTQLRVRESYLDTAGRFLMQVRTGALNLEKWNEVLVPLVGAEVLRGHLDSLTMTALGNNGYSKGQLQMYYRGLKLRLLDKKKLPEKTQTFMNKVVSWAANALILRKNNRGKRSPVFFERLTDKSPINFLIKSILSGIKSSIGLPGIRKQERRYMKKLKKQASLKNTSKEKPLSLRSPEVLKLWNVESAEG
ncbi:hypothetical protein A8C56_02105 [Niabella ginsenosidivorans]|uniref:Uncharacterized protein n=1 Tax=Niabella ginsenosidivorans TaxID=1176587 RepID=A0A1A9HYR1_9BACT|nr:hypothetical protein A8C56_02105 [Niabella ginsenosidivorans]